MWPRMQKHSDGWVWITEQYVCLSQVVFHFVKRGFGVFILHKLPISQEGFLSLSKHVSLNALIKQQNHNTTPQQEAFCSAFIGSFAG